MTNELSQYDTITYQWFIAYGPWNRLPAWHIDQWIPIHTLLTPFVKAASARASGFIEITDHGPLLEKQKKYKLGRIGWNQRSQEKWAFGSQSGFTDAEHMLWQVQYDVPGPTVCMRENRPHDLHFRVENLAHRFPGHQIVFMLIRADIFDGRGDCGQRLFDALQSLFAACECGQRRGSWDDPRTRGVFSDNDQGASFYVNNVFWNAVPNDESTILPGLSEIDDRWTVLKTMA